LSVCLCVMLLSLIAMQMCLQTGRTSTYY
jgi:hypothetical protein